MTAVGARLNTMTILTKIKEVEKALDRIEQGRYVDKPISWATDQIAWLWKFHHISEEKMTELTTRATYIIDTYCSD